MSNEIYHIHRTTKMENDVMQKAIVCKCGHETTRAACPVTETEGEHLLFKNYDCPECGEFLRCDTSVIIQEDESDESDDSE